MKFPVGWIALYLGCSTPAKHAPNTTDSPPEDGTTATVRPPPDETDEPHDSPPPDDDCVIAFPAVVTEPDDTGDPVVDDSGDPELPEIDEAGLIAHWPLDFDWTDRIGGYTLSALEAGGFSTSDVARSGANAAYGPTGRTTANGAYSSDVPALDLSTGITYEGWIFKTNNDTGGTWFGFGDGTWGTPAVLVSDSWGLIGVTTGASSDRKTVRYPRPSTGCWHHIAAVLTESDVTLYVDGVAQVPVDGTPVTSTTGLWGGDFSIGRFTGNYGGDMRVDEVRLWDRALTSEEVGLAATAEGRGKMCPDATAAWEPGPRCDWSTPGIPETPVVWGEVRVLTEDTVLVVHDPTPHLRQRIETACGPYLAAMEQVIADGDGPALWWAAYQRGFAFQEAEQTTLPAYVDAISRPDHFLFATCNEDAAPATRVTHWPVAVREAWLPPMTEAGDWSHLSSAEVAWTTVLTLPYPMQAGEPYAIQDKWGNRFDFVFDPSETVSWLFKVDQEGYLADAPDKFAYLGFWRAQDGALDIRFLEDRPFDVVDVNTGESVFQGYPKLRSVGTAATDPMGVDDLSGEQVLELDFGAVTRPGTYTIQIEGVGRSFVFEIGQQAVSNAFFVTARGLTHNRCGMDLTEDVTPWTRGDIHATYQGGFPPDSTDYQDHSAEGWGFLDETGAYVPYSNFTAVAATATDIALPDVRGGWHDAGDFDRRTYHLLGVQDLVTAYLMFPDNFTDAQLAIPESGNGVPDILDEAIWGLDVFRLGQTAEGGVGTWIEATSHPLTYDPGEDTQRYYLSLSTRNSSLDYAQHAARLGRTLVGAGAQELGEQFIESARRAYIFGTDPSRRVSHSWRHASGATHRWVEAPTPDAGRLLWATVQLFLATGEAQYGDALPGMDAAFRNQLANLWWQNRIFTLVDVVLESDRLPAGWGDDALRSIVTRADTFANAVDTHAYRRAWYNRDHGYFTLEGWGSARYMPLRPMVAAWRLTGDETYRRAALLGLNYLHGANPFGRVHVTGLGDHAAATALHLPSWADEWDEPVPGIPLYGPGVGVPYVATSRIAGRYEDSRTDPPFDGLSLALLPSPWDRESMVASDVSDALNQTLPPWRRFVALESQVVGSMEFTVWETTSVAAAVTGALMGPGFLPTDAQRTRTPRTEDALRSDLWMLP